jgi:uncharacterized protein (DUF1778 family)
MSFEKMIIFRVSEAERTLFRLAARARGKGLSAFLRDAARAEIERVLAGKRSGR